MGGDAGSATPDASREMKSTSNYANQKAPAAARVRVKRPVL